MSKLIKRMVAIARRVGRRRVGHASRARQPVIVCGLDYHAYRLLVRLVGSMEYRVLALIDDEPWNHATEMQGVRVYYPSEMASLVERHGVAAVVHGDACDPACFDTTTRAALAELSVPFVYVPPDATENVERYLTSALRR